MGRRERRRVALIFADIFKAWDRLATALFVTLPRRLAKAQKFRNAYLNAVK